MTGVGEYDGTVADLLERMLVTVIGTAGFWGRRVFLVGGLVPRYLYGASSPHFWNRVGTRDADLAVRLLIDDLTPRSYETRARSLLGAGFSRAPFVDDPAYRWRKEAGISSLILEFICDTDEVPPGSNYRPHSMPSSGAGLEALNVRGARLVCLDSRLILINAESLDSRGPANVGLRVSGLLPFMVLKILAFVDRRQGRDAYDIVWTLANHKDGPRAAGREMAASPVAAHPLAAEAIALLRSRFVGAGKEGPMAYAAFLGVAGSLQSTASLRIEAVETVRVALKAFDDARVALR